MSAGERELTVQQWQQMTDIEQREWNKLCTGKWYLEAKERIKNVIKQVPPFKMYRLVSTGHIVSIVEYVDKKDDEEAPVVVSVSAHPDYNADLKIAEKRIWGVPPEELQPIGLRCVMSVQRQIIQSKGAVMPTRRLIDPRRRDEVTKPNA